MAKKLTFESTFDEIGWSLRHTLDEIKLKGETKELKYEMLLKYGRLRFMEGCFSDAYQIFRQCSIHSIDNGVNDINELESRKDMIKGKLAVAKTQERINKMGSSVVSANDSISSFKKYEEMADKALDKANAMAELNRSSSEQSIEDLTKKYASDTTVDDELAALKASLGK